MDGDKGAPPLPTHQNLRRNLCTPEPVAASSSARSAVVEVTTFSPRTFFFSFPVIKFCHPVALSAYGRWLGSIRKNNMTRPCGAKGVLINLLCARGTLDPAATLKDACFGALAVFRMKGDFLLLKFCHVLRLSVRAGTRSRPFRLESTGPSCVPPCKACFPSRCGTVRGASLHPTTARHCNRDRAYDSCWGRRGPSSRPPARTAPGSLRTAGLPLCKIPRPQG